MIGNAANEIPSSGQLGRMAFQDPKSVVLEPQVTAVPLEAGQMTFQLSSNTSLLIRVRGTDGFLRAVTLTLA